MDLRVNDFDNREAGVRLLEGIKLYRDVVVGGKLYRGSRDIGRKRGIDYITSVLPNGYFFNKTVLDLGCAGGAICFRAALQGCKLATGVDTDDDSISAAIQIKNENDIGNVRFLKLDLFDFFSTNKDEYDIVFALNILHHMENPVALLREISRIAQEAVCIETPMNDIYEPRLRRVVRSRNQAHIAFMENNGFALVKEFTSSTDSKNFFGGGRIVYLFEVNRERKSKLEQLEKYREYRDECRDYVYSNPCFLPVASDNLVDHLKELMKEGVIHRHSNFLLLGPNASGKSYIYYKAREKRRAHKVFQHTETLDEFLNPDEAKHNMFSYIVPGHNLDDVIARLKEHPKITCIICFCDFDAHVARLLQRERIREGTLITVSGRDEPLQYDYIALIERLAHFNIKCFIVDTGYGHDTSCEEYLGRIPWYKKYQSSVSIFRNSLVEGMARWLDNFMYFLKRRQFKRMARLLVGYMMRLLRNVTVWRNRTKQD